MMGANPLALMRAFALMDAREKLPEDHAACLLTDKRFNEADEWLVSEGLAKPSNTGLGDSRGSLTPKGAATLQAIEIQEAVTAERLACVLVAEDHANSCRMSAGNAGAQNNRRENETMRRAASEIDLVAEAIRSRPNDV